MDEEILKRIDILAGKLEVTATTLYAAFLREMVARSCVKAACCVLGLVPLFFLWRFVNRLAKGGDDAAFFSGLTTVVAALFASLLVGVAGESLMDALSPHIALVEKLK